MGEEGHGLIGTTERRVDFLEVSNQRIPCFSSPREPSCRNIIRIKREFSLSHVERRYPLSSRCFSICAGFTDNDTVPLQTSKVVVA